MSAVTREQSKPLVRCPNCGEWNDMHGCIVNDRGNICYNRPFNLFNHNRELQQQLATITQERDALKRIIDDTLREVPVGNVNAHIPENLPMDMEYYVQETVKQDFEIERLEKERDALREENTRLRKYIGVMDAALKIPNGASTTAERCKRTNSLIGSDDWMEEPACPCVVCIDHVLTPSGEAGKGGGA